MLKEKRNGRRFQKRRFKSGVIFQILHLTDASVAHHGAPALTSMPYNFVHFDENAAYLRVKYVPHNIDWPAFTSYG